ncbi:MAG: hypothetical protein V1801_02885 [Candidatus Falkowbacteria bacterium]
MSDINFLEDKKHGDDQQPKDKDNKKQKLAWSNPKKEAKGHKNSPFSFLPFVNKKEPPSSSLASIIDKNKIKQSREEILNLIKRHENSKPLPKENGKNFLRTLGEKLKKQPEPKEILIDYHGVFNREKDHKNQVGKIFNVKPEAESRPALPPAKKPKDKWFNGLIELFKNKIIALNARRNETAKIIKLQKIEKIKPVAVKQPEPVAPAAQLEKKSAEVKEINIKEKEPIHKNEIKQRILETNLIQGELVTFFDWRSKVIVLVSAILMPIFVVGVVYYGLGFYQKSNQIKNLAQAQKFVELEQNILEEEAGLKEILDFQAQLKTVSRIFAQHLYWTNFFNFLEDNTIKDVYFENFEGDTSGYYAMDTLTASYSNIAEQVNIFKNNKKIITALASGGEMVAGDGANKSLVKFILNFSVLKSIFTE